MSLQLAGDLADLVRLDDVALFHVVEVLDPDAALEPFAHLTDVILEAAESGRVRGQLALEIGRRVALLAHP